MGKIAIVSDSVTVLNSLQSKLALLREDDHVIKSEIATAYKLTAAANVILLHAPEISDITLTTITKLKNNKNSIILVLEHFDPKLLLEAYDKGVNDFCGTNITPSELLIRIVNAKKTIKNLTISQKQKILLQNKGVLKYSSDIYTNLEDILIPEFHKELYASSILAIEINKEEQEHFILNNQETILTSLLRETDFIINYDDFKYLIILTKTTTEKGTRVFEKIYTKLDKCITGVLFDYQNENPKELLSKIEHLKIEREENNLTLYINKNEQPEETETDWLSDSFSEEPTKTYKLFQNIYTAKTEKVIQPVFYRSKQKFERQLANSKIKYYTDKKSAEFILANFDRTNSFKIELKNSAKIGIEIKYTGLDAPENENLELPFSQLTTHNLSEMIENFINKGELNEHVGQ